MPKKSDDDVVYADAEWRRPVPEEHYSLPVEIKMQPKKIPRKNPESVNQNLQIPTVLFLFCPGPNKSLEIVKIFQVTHKTWGR